MHDTYMVISMSFFINLKQIFPEHQPPTDNTKNSQAASNENLFSMIEETEAFCANNQYSLEKIHCSGCADHCPLSQPYCGRGAMLQQKFRELQ